MRPRPVVTCFANTPAAQTLRISMHTSNARTRHMNATLHLIRPMALLCLFVIGCALPPVRDPELPPRHWLEQAANETSAQSLPDIDLKAEPLDFTRCLLLAMRQSPLLHNSAVEMEIAGLRTESAFWSQLPEVRARFSVTANITRNDEDNEDDGYGDTSYRVGLGVNAYNPVAAHFSYEARRLMEELAVLTHCKAVENLAGRIGETLVRLDTLERMLAVQNRRPLLADTAVRYFSLLEPGQEKQSLEYARARQQARVARAMVEKTEAEKRMLLSSLKLLLGVAPEEQLRVGGPGAIMEHLPDTDGNTAWEAAWDEGADKRMLEVGLKLQDFNVLLAWSRFMPDTHLDVFTANADSSLSGSSEDDVFTSVGLSFPVMDWGNRARGVREARLQKTQFADRERQGRSDFAAAWAHGRQEYEALLAELALHEENLELAKLETRKAKIEFENGVGGMSQVMDKEDREIDAQIRLIELQGRLNQWRVKAIIAGGYLTRELVRLP
jgi:outer membrane protein TolC